MFDRNTIQVQDARDIGVFSRRVYGWMSIALAFTAVVALFVIRTGLYVTLAPLWWVWALGTFAIAVAIQRLAIQHSIQRSTITTIIGLFLTYAALEGLMFGTVLPVFAAAYGGQIIWAAFASAAGIFGIAMVYGLFTKADLTSLGRILSLGLVGLIVMSLIVLIVSFFTPVTMLHLFVSWIGLLLFVGLTAYDAQAIRSFSLQADTSSVSSYKLSMIMALRMYLNVIMIFWYLLQIFSHSSKDR